MLFDQHSDGGEVNESQIGIIALIVTSSDTAEPPQFQEEAFDQMPFFVKPPITIPWVSGIAFWRDGIHGVLICYITTNSLCSICSVAYDIAVGKIDFG